MRKFCTMLLVGLLGVALCGVGHAATVELVSEAGIPVYGPVASDLPLESAEWGDPNIDPGAIAFKDVPVDWPQVEGAVWITTDDQADQTASTAESWRRFQDELALAIPCTAYNLTGTLEAAAKDSLVVYHNGSALTDGTFTPEAENVLDFIVETGAGNPAALIYKATFSYELPKVLWRPPLVKARRAIVKLGTTLPIKFRLADDSGVLFTRQNVYLSISGPGLEEIKYELGTGPRGLRFDEESGRYMAIFKTKRWAKDLKPGVQYMISVKDGCTGEALDSKTFQVFGKRQRQL